jgi:hypothetical protein
MTTRVTIQTTDGRIVNALNWRMLPSQPPSGPSVPASPIPLDGGMYHVKTARGWIDLPANQVLSMSLHTGAFT